MKWFWVVVPALVLLLSLAGCGRVQEQLLELGEEEYICRSVTVLGAEYPVEEIYEGKSSIRFGSFGVAELIIDGQKTRARWEMAGGGLQLELGGMLCPCTMGNGIVTIDMLGSGLVLTFAEPGIEYEIPVPEQFSRQEDWYGWWMLYDAAGDYLDLDYQRWDAQCSIVMDESGAGLLTLWDEESSMSEPLAECRVELSPTGSCEEDILISTDGWFLDGFGTIGRGDWVLDPWNSDYSDCIIIEGSYEDDTGSFSYVFMLRPWGLLWDDVEAADPDLMPCCYYDWYLPLIEKGSSMPSAVSPGYSRSF